MAIKRIFFVPTFLGCPPDYLADNLKRLRQVLRDPPKLLICSAFYPVTARTVESLHEMYPNAYVLLGPLQGDPFQRILFGDLLGRPIEEIIVIAPTTKGIESCLTWMVPSVEVITLGGVNSIQGPDVDPSPFCVLDIERGRFFSSLEYYTREIR